MFCFSISGLVKWYPRELFISNVVLYMCMHLHMYVLFMKLQMVNSMENITWSELGKQNIQAKFCHPCVSSNVTIAFFPLLLDINECSTNAHNCGANAFCSNTEGSYNCTCSPGYNGNGTSCTGKSYHYHYHHYYYYYYYYFIF